MKSLQETGKLKIQPILVLKCLIRAMNTSQENVVTTLGAIVLLTATEQLKLVKSTSPGNEV